MRLRYWTALTVIVGVAVSLAMREDRRAPVIGPPDVVTSSTFQERDDTTAMSSEPEDVATASQIATVDRQQDVAPPDEETIKWSRAVEPGESLDVLLAEAGLEAVRRAEVSSAIGSEFDLRSLQPGHRLALEIGEDGTPQTATLEVANGLQVQAVFGAAASVRLIPPALEAVRRAGEAKIKGSIYAALEEAGMPTRFATDLELVLAGTLDLQRKIVGDESFRLLWREYRLGDRVMGEPAIDFAELDLGDEHYEILWPEDDANRTRIYKDGHLLRIFDQPIRGARLSSAFGLRKHPVHGTVRMHSGVDLAAAQGSKVRATQSGEIVFMGRRGGYGLMVEIDHPRDLRTVYAHLSALNETLKVGQRITAGHEIGRVGSTGTSTGPHLHYEVLYKNNPVAPLTDMRLLQLDDASLKLKDAPALVDGARDELERLLSARTN